MSLALPGLALIVVITFYGLVKWVLDMLNSPIQDLPGPPSASFFFGNAFQILKSTDEVDLHRGWVEKYGATIGYRGIFWPKGRIYSTDLKAVHHILKHSYIYHKPDFVTRSVRKVVGDGIVFTEDNVHKRQRKVLNPAFGPPQIRELTSTFFERSIRLRDIWVSLADSKGEIRLDALSWLSKATLDIIGEAGFAYDMEALSQNTNRGSELSQACAAVFRVGVRAKFTALVAMLRPQFPILYFLPEGRDAEKMMAKEIMNGIGRQLLAERRGEKVLRRSRKDVLSLLLRANNSVETHASQRLTDAEVIAQIPTLIVAGHETTSNATTWALYALAKNKEVQKTLREELLSVPTDSPDMEDLNALSYLDLVVRETLRLYPPVSTTSRVAMEDDILPLEKPLIDKKGQVHYEIRIHKGQDLAIPIAQINTSKEIWGDDALEFKPSRWMSVPKAAGGIPGVWGNLMSFAGGPRGCIAYRFALVEMKALLFTLIRAFEVNLTVPPEDVIQKSELVTRPVLRTDPDNANQLPVLLRIVKS